MLHVHDLADNVAFEAEKAGRNAAQYAAESFKESWSKASLKLPVKEKNYGNSKDSTETTCIGCPKGCTLHLEYPKDRAVSDIKESEISVTGFSCPKGEEYGKNEILCPMRTVCSCVRLKDSDIAMLPVRTKGDIPKSKIADVMREIHACEVKLPVKNGDVIINNISGTGIDLVATRDMQKG